MSLPPKETISLFGVEYAHIQTLTFTRGDVIWVPKSGMQDCIAYLLFDNQSEDLPFGLINMVGYKAGLFLVSFPKDCLFDGQQGVSKKWIKENWEQWIGLGKYEDAIFLREASRALSE